MSFQKFRSLYRPEEELLPNKIDPVEGMPKIPILQCW